eukprot:3709892-Amphidinium_carterae.1
MYSKAMRDVEEAQKTMKASLLKLKESDDSRVLALSKDQERIKQLEAAVQELMAKQVKEQKAWRPNYAEPLHAAGIARGRSRGGCQKSQRQNFVSRSANSDTDYVHI